MSETVLTVREAAKILDVHPETVRLYLRSGTLKGTQSSHRRGWRIRQDDLREYIRQYGDDAVRAGLVLDRHAEATAALEELRELRKLLAAAPDTPEVREFVARQLPKALDSLERGLQILDDAPQVTLDKDYEREQQQN